MLGLRHHLGTAIDLFQGDITEFVCDVMVNAANESLAVGSGVCGAIHRVGGPSIAEACAAIGSCPSGQSVLTTAGTLPAKSLIHAVGPVWQDGKSDEADRLASAYRSSLDLAARNGLGHIAFPSISTGVYGFPIDKAAPLAMETIKAYLDQNKGQKALRRITFVLFDRNHYQAFQKALFSTFIEQDGESA